jgi:hypothetical protein
VSLEGKDMRAGLLITISGGAFIALLVPAALALNLRYGEAMFASRLISGIAGCF